MKYTHLLPFLDKEELRKVASEIINGEIKNVRLETLFPFLGREYMNDLVNELIAKKESKTLTKALPFLAHEKVLEIYQAAEKGDLPDFDTSRCIPFLGANQVKKIFRELIHAASEDTSDVSDEENDDVDDEDDDDDDEDDEA